MKDEDERAIQKPHGSFFLVESRGGIFELSIFRPNRGLQFRILLRQGRQERQSRSVKRPNELRARWHELLRRQGSRRRRDELGADWIANRLANNLVRLRSQLAPLMAETRAN
jgi:hypothetical protein